MQTGSIANGLQMYTLLPNARSRGQAIQMVVFFLVGAVGQQAGAVIYQYHGWIPSMGMGLGFVLLAFALLMARTPFEKGWVPGWMRGGRWWIGVDVSERDYGKGKEVAEVVLGEVVIGREETALQDLRYQVGEVVKDCRTLAERAPSLGALGGGGSPNASFARIMLPPIISAPDVSNVGVEEPSTRIHEAQATGLAVDEESGHAEPVVAKPVKPPAHLFNTPIKTAHLEAESGDDEISPLAKAKIRAAAAAAAALDKKLQKGGAISSDPHLVAVTSKPRWYRRFYRRFFIQEAGHHAPRSIGLSILDLSSRHRQYARMTHPHSLFRQLWNAAITILTCIAFVTIPLFIGFEELSHGLKPLSLILTVFYILTIITNFRTGYFDDQHVVMEPHLVARRYMRGGTFFFDIVTSIPWIYIVDAFTKERVVVEAKWRTLCLINALWAVKLLLEKGPGLFSITKKYANMRYSLHSALFDSLWVFGAIVLYWHWSACIENWIDVIENSEHLETEGGFERYTIAFFNAASEMFSAGWGVPTPPTSVKRWLKIINILVGAVFEATLVGHISTFLISLDSSGRMYQEKLDEVNQYIAYKNLDATLRKRILSYYEFKYSNNKYFHEQGILRELNEPLRQAVCIHNCRSFLLKVPFFRDGDNAFINQLVTSLTINHYLPGDIVIAEDTSGDDMHFIASGICEVVTQGTVRARLTPGLFFGEISLLFGEMKRTATIRVVTPCVLYSLRKRNLDEVLEHHPIMAHRIRKVAQDRLAQIKTIKKLDLRRKSTVANANAAQHSSDPTNIYDAAEKVTISPSTSDERLSERLSVSSAEKARPK
ncbi:hypothetical protein HDV00_005978 [Rhizophlyctis rosea]|nr:hypothetical protein HDV00_005978 [Rhizophlyctis rosea]